MRQAFVRYWRAVISQAGIFSLCSALSGREEVSPVDLDIYFDLPAVVEGALSPLGKVLQLTPANRLPALRSCAVSRFGLDEGTCALRLSGRHSAAKFIVRARGGWGQ